MNLDKENIINGLDKLDKIKISNLLDKYLLYENKGITSYSNFLDLRELNIWENRVKKKNISYKIIEKFPDSEKKAVWFGPFEDGDDSITIFHGKCNDKIRHQDVLGSLFGIGLNTNTIGDIVVEDNEFYFTNLTKLNNFIFDNLTTIGNLKVELEIVNNVVFTMEHFSDIEIIVNSMRLDIIVSKLANTSRSITLDKIKNHEVFLNYQEVSKPTLVLKENDILSIRKVGKFKIGKVLNTTKKYKMILEIKKYN